MIYAFGSNGAGQLGIGHTEDVSTPQPMKGLDNIGPVKKIVAGGNHTLILAEDGTVRATGSNEHGRAGLLGHTIVSTEPQPVILHAASAEISRFHDIAATWSASFFVAMDRRSVVVCGTGEHGELGLGNGVTSASQPARIELPDTVEKIESCLSHTVVVLSNGDVWGWGKGRKGQLGEPKEDSWVPRRITNLALSVVKKAVCGADFTCMIGVGGEIVVLGSDRRDRFRLLADVPRLVPDWQDISASWGSTFVRTKATIVAWGRNDRGQLPPADLPPLVSFAAGSEHWLALTTNGVVLSGGWGEHGNCGMTTDDRGVVKAPGNTIECGIAVEKVFAGCATSFLVGSPLRET